ncbi:MAG: HTH domain-containing protein [Defluviitaleaceae bacterium]|nr:HTH domain-containing protein [Defluviitaleaceae bacterium]
MTYKKLAIAILNETKVPMTAMEIWDYSKKTKIDTTKFQGKTPWYTIGAHIYTDLQSKGDKSDFKKIAGRPIKFGLNALSYNDSQSNNAITAIIDKNKTTRKEKELHGPLASFAFSQFSAYTKTISHGKSKKGSKGENEWLHPDMVGVYTPRYDWEDKVLVLNGLVGDTSLKIFSFEIKLNLDFTNLRQHFFQAVSNSYWANESYLVAEIVDDSRDFKEELKRLSALYGIGIIRIDVDDPQESEIVFNATYKSQLDWETINKLCELNPDYKGFINAITIILEDKNKNLSREAIEIEFDKIELD